MDIAPVLLLEGDKKGVNPGVKGHRIFFRGQG